MLESHLKKLCEENRDYENLRATLNLNKKACNEMLKTVIMNYPSYSLHDHSHSETIISNIEMLLGEERIRELSATDTWLILHAAYVHDLGMALIYDDIDELWKQDDFMEFWEEQKSAADDDLKKSIEYIESITKSPSDNLKGSAWPLEVRRRVTYIISCYFRGKHASFSREYIRKMSTKWKTDLSHNGLISDRLIYLLGDIAFSHTQSSDYVLSLAQDFLIEKQLNNLF